MISGHKRINKIDSFNIIISYLIAISFILTFIFSVLSRYLNPKIAFYFNGLFAITLDFAFINVFIICIVVISRNKNDLKGVIIMLLTLILCAAFVVLSFKPFLIDMIKDIPNAMSSKYSVTQGTCNNAYNTKSQFHFEINNISFNTDRSEMKNVIIGEKYRVVYLQNSKYIIDVKSIEN